MIINFLLWVDKDEVLQLVDCTLKVNIIGKQKERINIDNKIKM
jgi:hypothetical protein